jgi:hypothetical protein
MGDGGTQWDAPNQQVVRDDASGPWEEGTGGSPEGPVADQLDAMTKAQLLEQAAAQGVDANEGMTKAEIIQAIEAG